MRALFSSFAFQSSPDWNLCCEPLIATDKRPLHAISRIPHHFSFRLDSDLKAMAD
jgi:hypothetical protein